MLSACTIVDEKLIIANELVVVNFEENRPKVRVATGSEHCKWRGKYNIDGHYYIGIECKVLIPP